MQPHYIVIHTLFKYNSVTVLLYFLLRQTHKYGFLLKHKDCFKLVWQQIRGRQYPELLWMFFEELQQHSCHLMAHE